MKFENIVSRYFGHDDLSVYHSNEWRNPVSVNKILYSILYRECYCFKDKYPQETKSQMEGLMEELLVDLPSIDTTNMSLYIRVIEYLEAL
jgi:hypothetical protein